MSSTARSFNDETGPSLDVRAPVVHPDLPLKRAVDIAVGAILLLPGATLAIAAALLILVVDHHRPLYIDQRVGRGGRRFGCWKLRTMVADDAKLAHYLAENPEEASRYASTRKLLADPRVTGVGRFLRTTSIDELPQIVNVLRGDMSLVGPRPLSPREFEARGAHGGLLASVAPGITGLWQVCGRSLTSDRRRIYLDDFYCRRRTLRMDLWIAARTPLAVLRRTGAR